MLCVQSHIQTWSFQGPDTMRQHIRQKALLVCDASGSLLEHGVCANIDLSFKTSKSFTDSEHLF